MEQLDGLHDAFDWLWWVGATLRNIAEYYTIHGAIEGRGGVGLGCWRWRGTGDATRG